VFVISAREFAAERLQRGVKGRNSMEVIKEKAERVSGAHLRKLILPIPGGLGIVPLQGNNLDATFLGQERTAHEFHGPEFSGPESE